ncbi:ADP-ribosylglycohydrolase family protein [Sulfurimonas sp.]|uniref:ADP-ribosylglycohydrolase family protein n=1 Tax=Sulfurimonas sp. TaxID=2022749 RepID=UPI0025EDF358|nr:ADP-ribosylglycohydrolase family protein [Sulfurimonas sp.]MBT5934606.1 ADP-ribosylglycohydrolase family protein [Sulfurimonas sp.]
MLPNQSLLALACGDSYGAYFERDGLMGVTYEIETLPSKPVVPMITDDTKMAMILFKHYIKHKNLFIEKISEEYRLWSKRWYRDTHICCFN